MIVRGEVDFSNADELALRIREAIEEWSPAVLRVDLDEATFIDSTGLGALIDGYRVATEAEARFFVVNPTLATRRVLAITGLTDFFGLTDPDQAAADLGADRGEPAPAERTRATAT